MPSDGSRSHDARVRPMIDPILIVQVPDGSEVERQLTAAPPASVTGGQVVVEVIPADGAGVLEPPAVGEVVASLPSPEALRRESAELRRVIGGAGPGSEPIVIVVEAAEELREDELAAAVDASSHASRAVILRVMRDA
jgi:hypothetical protein